MMNRYEMIYIIDTGLEETARKEHLAGVVNEHGGQGNQLQCAGGGIARGGAGTGTMGSLHKTGSSCNGLNVLSHDWRKRGTGFPFFFPKRRLFPLHSVAFSVIIHARHILALRKAAPIVREEVKE